MDKTNQKIVTLSFALFSAVSGFTLSMLLRTAATLSGSFAKALDLDLVRHGVPVVFALSLFAFLQFNSKVTLWADEIVVEVRKVVWPSQKDTTAMTIAVVVMVLISSVIVSTFDLISSYLINWIVK